MSQASKPAERSAKRLLVWDAPNIDVTIGELLGHKPCRAQRPNFEALADWLCDRASQGEEIQAAVFVNMKPECEGAIHHWVRHLRSLGFSVFCKPKDGNSDIDPNMCEFIREQVSQGGVTEVLVASGDGRNFNGLLTNLAEDGIAATVLGFTEVSRYASQNPRLTLIDLESIPGLFPQSLPRLRNLPLVGGWMPASTTLRGRGRGTVLQLDSTDLIATSDPHVAA